MCGDVRGVRDCVRVCNFLIQNLCDISCPLKSEKQVSASSTANIERTD